MRDLWTIQYQGHLAIVKRINATSISQGEQLRALFDQLDVNAKQITPSAAQAAEAHLGEGA